MLAINIPRHKMSFARNKKYNYIPRERVASHDRAQCANCRQTNKGFSHAEGEVGRKFSGKTLPRVTRARMKQLCHNHAHKVESSWSRARKIANNRSYNPPLFVQLFRTAKRLTTRKKRTTLREPRKLIYLTAGVINQRP